MREPKCSAVSPERTWTLLDHVAERVDDLDLHQVGRHAHAGLSAEAQVAAIELAFGRHRSAAEHHGDEGDENEERQTLGHGASPSGSTIGFSAS
jgi:hypothetical protein